MVGRDQYGYIKGPYYMVKLGPMPPGEHNKVESKKLHKLGRFPKLRAAGRAAGAAGKSFSIKRRKSLAVPPSLQEPRRVVGTRVMPHPHNHHPGCSKPLELPH